MKYKGDKFACSRKRIYIRARLLFTCARISAPTWIRVVRIHLVKAARDVTLRELLITLL